MQQYVDRVVYSNKVMKALRTVGLMFSPVVKFDFEVVNKCFGQATFDSIHMFFSLKSHKFVLEGMSPASRPRRAVLAVICV